MLGYFGTAFSQQPGKGRNLRVPRQLLRRMLYEQLAPGTVRWGWRLRSYCEHDDRRGVTARLQRVAHAHAHAHAVGGADTGAGGKGGEGGAGGEGGGAEGAWARAAAEPMLRSLRAAERRQVLAADH